MTKDEALKIADEVFDDFLSDENDPNTRIIAARRANNGDGFKPEDMIARASKAERRVEEAEEALALFSPALERLKLKV